MAKKPQVLKLYIWQKDALTVFFFKKKKNKKAQRNIFSESWKKYCVDLVL